MMDIVAMLRISGTILEREAADEIERLRAELEDRTAAVIISDGGQALACSASVAAVFGSVRAERDAQREMLRDVCDRYADYRAVGGYVPNAIKYQRLVGAIEHANYALTAKDKQ